MTTREQALREQNRRLREELALERNRYANLVAMVEASILAHRDAANADRMLIEMLEPDE